MVLEESACICWCGIQVASAQVCLRKDVQALYSYCRAVKTPAQAHLAPYLSQASSSGWGSSIRAVHVVMLLYNIITSFLVQKCRCSFDCSRCLPSCVICPPRWTSTAIAYAIQKSLRERLWLLLNAIATAAFLRQIQCTGGRPKCKHR